MKSSTTTTFDYLVFIGRFQPFHRGHEAVVRYALERSHKVIILVGSANRPRSIKDPWTEQERMMMIQKTFTPEENLRLVFGAISDNLYNDEAWARGVQEEVCRLIECSSEKEISHKKLAIALIGHEKDSTSYYLNMFPQWERIEVPNVKGLSATALRTLFWEDSTRVASELKHHLPAGVYDWIRTFSQNNDYEQLKKEFAFIEHYKKSWSVAPYPPVFVTVDAVVVHSGHVLLIRRRAEPGKGLWAWPGGFVGADEKILDACIRELREETRLKIPEPVLRGSIKAQKVFDHPTRSLRGRTITHAFLFEFLTGDLPPIKGSDDADKARWVPLAEFFNSRHQLFEDHFDIGAFFLGTH